MPFINNLLPTLIPYLIITPPLKHRNLFSLENTFSNCLPLFKYLPKDLTQFYQPEQYYWRCKHLGHRFSYYIVVLINDEKFELGAKLAETQLPFSIIFNETDSDKVLNWLGKLDKPFLVSSTLDGTLKKMREQKTINGKIFSNIEGFKEKFINFIEMKLVKSEKLSNLLEEIAIRSEEHNSSNDLKIQIPNFIPAQNNYFNTALKFGDFNVSKYDFVDVSKDKKRSRYILKGIKLLDELAMADESGESINEKVKTNDYLLPSIIISLPFINRRLYKEKRHQEANLFLKALKIQQDINDYIFYHELDDEKQKYTAEFDAIQAARAYIAERLITLDALLYLHSSFDYGASYRAPLRGKDINQAISAFSPEIFNQTKNTDILGKIRKLGEVLSSAFNTEFIDYMTKRNGPVVCISDLPLEWLDLKGVPLIFQHDICRLPETSHASRSCQDLRCKFA